MKILHYYKTYWPDSFGGTERAIYGIADGLKKDGVKTTVLTLTPSSSPKVVDHNGVTVVQLKRNFRVASTGVSFGAVEALKSLAAVHDIVHYHSPWPFMDLTHLLVRHGKPTVLTYHADPIGNPLLVAAYRPLLKRYLRSVDHIVSTSPQYLETSEFLNREREKVSVVPIGLPAKRTTDRKTALKSELKDKYGELFFLFVGVLRHYKGLEHLLEAAQHTKAKILIAGDGLRRAEYERRCAELQLNNVTFLGHVDEAKKDALLSLCLGFVFPSHTRSEAFGVSLVEAARAGKPMITCELGTGTSFVNRYKETGLVVEPANPRSLADAINTLAENPALAREFGKNAAQHFLRHLTQEKMADAYLSIYKELQSKP